MTDETAKALAEAMIKLAAAIEKLAPSSSLAGGINVYHHGMQQVNTPPYNFQHPWSGGAGSSNVSG